MAITPENLKWAMGEMFDERLPEINKGCREYTDAKIELHTLEHDLEVESLKHKLTAFNKIMIVIGIVAILGIDIIKHWISSLLGMK